MLIWAVFGASLLLSQSCVPQCVLVRLHVCLSTLMCPSWLVSVLLNFVEESYLGDESTPLRELLEQAEWKDFVHKTPWPTHFPRYCG